MKRSTTVIKVKDYACSTLNLTRREGPYSAQRFKEEILQPNLAKGYLIIDLDGFYAISSSFLRESFGGLCSIFDSRYLEEYLLFHTYNHPDVVSEIMSYMREAYDPKRDKILRRERKGRDNWGEVVMLIMAILFHVIMWIVL